MADRPARLTIDPLYSGIEISVPYRMLAVLYAGYSVAGDGGIDPIPQSLRDRVESSIAPFRDDLMKVYEHLEKEADRHGR